MFFCLQESGGETARSRAEKVRVVVPGRQWPCYLERSFLPGRFWSFHLMCVCQRCGSVPTLLRSCAATGTPQHCTRHTALVTLHSSHCTRHTALIKLHSSHCTRCTAPVTLHLSLRTRHTAPVTPHSSHCTRHTALVT